MAGKRQDSNPGHTTNDSETIPPSTPNWTQGPSSTGFLWVGAYPLMVVISTTHTIR